MSQPLGEPPNPAFPSSLSWYNPVVTLAALLFSIFTRSYITTKKEYTLDIRDIADGARDGAATYGEFLDRCRAAGLGVTRTSDGTMKFRSSRPSPPMPRASRRPPATACPSASTSSARRRATAATSSPPRTSTPRSPRTARSTPSPQRMRSRAAASRSPSATLRVGCPPPSVPRISMAPASRSSHSTRTPSSAAA